MVAPGGLTPAAPALVALDLDEGFAKSEAATRATIPAAERFVCTSAASAASADRFECLDDRRANTVEESRRAKPNPEPSKGVPCPLVGTAREDERPHLHRLFVIGGPEVCPSDYAPFETDPDECSAAAELAARAGQYRGEAIGHRSAWPASGHKLFWGVADGVKPRRLSPGPLADKVDSQAIQAP